MLNNNNGLFLNCSYDRNDEIPIYRRMNNEEETIIERNAMNVNHFI